MTSITALRPERPGLPLLADSSSGMSANTGY